MALLPDPSAYPLCGFFLTGYLTKKDDPVNFRPNDVPGVFQRHERVFEDALQVLGITKEALRKRPEFNFDSGDVSSLESASAILRVVVCLHRNGFTHIALIKAGPTTGADITCEKNGAKLCCEVKAITKQSKGRDDFFLEDQLYEKIRENIAKARNQLKTTARALQCKLTMFISVMNWEIHTMVLGDSDFQNVVEKLEREDHELDGIDIVLLITGAGLQHFFISEGGKCINC